MNRIDRPVNSSGTVRIRVARAAIGLAMIVLMQSAMLGLGGCGKPLLSPTEPRSQYDRYDAIRAQRAQSFVFDEFGRRRPNLRGRLIEKQ